MKCFTCLIRTLIVLTLFYLIFPREACAYLNPGTSSFILQLIIAALVGGLFVVKLFWDKIKNFFENLFSRRKKHEKVKDQRK